MLPLFVPCSGRSTHSFAATSTCITEGLRTVNRSENVGLTIDDALTLTPVVKDRSGPGSDAILRGRPRIAHRVDGSRYVQLDHPGDYLKSHLLHHWFFWMVIDRTETMKWGMSYGTTKYGWAGGRTKIGKWADYVMAFDRRLGGRSSIGGCLVSEVPGILEKEALNGYTENLCSSDTRGSAMSFRKLVLPNTSHICRAVSTMCVWPVPGPSRRHQRVHGPWRICACGWISPTSPCQRRIPPRGDASECCARAIFAILTAGIRCCCRPRPRSRPGVRPAWRSRPRTTVMSSLPVSRSESVMAPLSIRSRACIQPNTRESGPP